MNVKRCKKWGYLCTLFMPCLACMLLSLYDAQCFTSYMQTNRAKLITQPKLEDTFNCQCGLHYRDKWCKVTTRHPSEVATGSNLAWDNRGEKGSTYQQVKVPKPHCTMCEKHSRSCCGC